MREDERQRVIRQKLARMECRAVDWSEYVPIVRSAAGTGCAMGFLAWQ